MRASLPRPRPARSSPRPPSIDPACVRSVSQQACAERLLCARPVLAAGATVGADAGSCGTQGGETQPSKPGARCCTPHTRMWTGPARPGPAEPALREAHGALGRRPLPTSRLQVVEIRIQASFQHLHDFLHRAMLNVIHAFFQIGLKRKKKKKLLYKTCLHEPWEGLLHKVLRGAVPWWGHCQPWAPQAVAFCLRNPRTSTELGMWHTRPASPG